MNLHSEEDRLQLIFSCAYAAVQTGFPHLAVRDIITPPHGWFDALLARQIAIRIVAADFDVPRRRIATRISRNRGRVFACIAAVNRRMADPVFAAAYGRMAALALELYARELQKADRWPAASIKPKGQLRNGRHQDNRDRQDLRSRRTGSGRSTKPARSSWPPRSRPAGSSMRSASGRRRALARRPTRSSPAANDFAHTSCSA